MAKPYLGGPTYLAPFTPPSGGWQQPANMMNSAAVAVTSGTATFCALDVGPEEQSYTALGVAVTTAQVAGTTTTTLGAYRDDGSGGRPNLVGGPVVSAAVTLTATGNRPGAVTWNPQPGRWWLAFLYVASVAPTTAPQVSGIANAAPVLWVPSAGAIGGSVRGLTATGLTVLPTTQVALTPATTITVVAAQSA